MISLDTDTIEINKIGAVTAKRLKKLGVETARDLLFYFPFRYDNFSVITPIEKLESGKSANVVGQIELIQNKRSFKRKMYITEALISDETESVKVIWFNQPFIVKNLRVGDQVSLAGKVEDDFGSFVMKSPVYEKVMNAQAVHTQGLVPNYRLTENITQKQIRFLIKQIISLSKEVKDWLPNEVKNNLKLLSLGEAINKIHFPRDQKDIDEARRRLSFNELFLIQVQSQIIRLDAQKLESQPIKFLEKETKKFVESLPFKLTDAQRKAGWEILKDIERDKPMSRLLEGDVGSGKTVVALLTMLNTALNKKQSALMVPTEILAKQHYESVCRLLADFDIKIGLVTRSDKKLNNELGIMNNGNSENKNKKSHNSLFIIHNADIVIGTHSLIQENIEFKNLALVIVDEQHRFGVEQRKRIIEKSGNAKVVPHFLSMTATPIPRSLAMALYGDLDISIINEMPKGRKQIITQVVPEEKRPKAYDFIREEIKKGRQAFVVCPLIDPSDVLGVKSVKEEFEKLDKNIFHDLKIGMLHGKMQPKEKEEIMQDFLDNKIKILVSTSVIEVGVDIPNASIIMIEGADRFGLAQLHQFRGRVGRSDFQSYCFLLAPHYITNTSATSKISRLNSAGFSDNESPATLKRLDALVKNNDGFALAKMDLKLRGPGEVYGTMQKGFPELKIASLFDYDLMKSAKIEAEKTIKKDESLNSWPELKERIGDHGAKTHLE